MSEKRIFVIRLSTGAALGVAVAAAVATPLSAASAAPQSAPSHAVAAVAAAQPDKDHAALGLSSDEKLVVRNVLTDRDGTQHVRYDRTFKGLRVVGGDLIVEKTAAGVEKSVQLQRQRQGGRRVDDPDPDAQQGRVRGEVGRQADRVPVRRAGRVGRRRQAASWPTTCW